jgi:hypothetical protein
MLYKVSNRLASVPSRTDSKGNRQRWMHHANAKLPPPLRNLLSGRRTVPPLSHRPHINPSSPVPHSSHSHRIMRRCGLKNGAAMTILWIGFTSLRALTCACSRRGRQSRSLMRDGTQSCRPRPPRTTSQSDDISSSDRRVDHIFPLNMSRKTTDAGSGFETSSHSSPAPRDPVRTPSASVTRTHWVLPICLPHLPPT